jgi:hypothetical protein
MMPAPEMDPTHNDTASRLRRVRLDGEPGIPRSSFVFSSERGTISRILPILRRRLAGFGHPHIVSSFALFTGVIHHGRVAIELALQAKRLTWPMGVLKRFTTFGRACLLAG